MHGVESSRALKKTVRLCEQVNERFGGVDGQDDQHHGKVLLYMTRSVCNFAWFYANHFRLAL